MVGLSFVQRAEDVDELQRALARLGRPDLGIVLKIETRRGFEKLPELLLAAMRAPADRRDDRARRSRRRVRLRAARRGPGGDPLALRGGPRAGHLGDAGARRPGAERARRRAPRSPTPPWASAPSA